MKFKYKNDNGYRLLKITCQQTNESYIFLTSEPASNEAVCREGRRFSGNKALTERILRYGWDSFTITELASGLRGAEASQAKQEAVKLFPGFNDPVRITANMGKWTKRVQCVESGKIYDTMKECYLTEDISPRGLSKAIKTGKPIKGRHFKEV